MTTPIDPNSQLPCEIESVLVVNKMGIRLPARVVGMIANLLRYRKNDYPAGSPISNWYIIVAAESALQTLKYMKEAFAESDADDDYIDQVNTYIQHEITQADLTLRVATKRVMSAT